MDKRRAGTRRRKVAVSALEVVEDCARRYRNGAGTPVAERERPRRIGCDDVLSNFSGDSSGDSECQQRDPADRGRHIEIVPDAVRGAPTHCGNRHRAVQPINAAIRRVRVRPRLQGGECRVNERLESRVQARRPPIRVVRLGDTLVAARATCEAHAHDQTVALRSDRKTPSCPHARFYASVCSPYSYSPLRYPAVAWRLTSVFGGRGHSVTVAQSVYASAPCVCAIDTCPPSSPGSTTIGSRP
jgi:hypothetical protein